MPLNGMRQTAGEMYDSKNESLSTLLRSTVKSALLTAISLWLFAGLAAAQNVTEECDGGGPLEPLVSLLNTINELLFIIGIALGGIGFVTAGILFVIPGQNYNRLAQVVAKNTFIGVILILSSDMIIRFLISQLGGIC